MSDNENRSTPYIGDAAVKPPVPVAIRRVLFAVAILSDLAAVAVGLLMQEEAMLFTLFLLGFGQIFLSSYITMHTATRLGLSVSWETVLTMRPLSLWPSLLVTT